MIHNHALHAGECAFSPADLECHPVSFFEGHGQTAWRKRQLITWVLVHWIVKLQFIPRFTGDCGNFTCFFGCFLALGLGDILVEQLREFFGRLPEFHKRFIQIVPLTSSFIARQ